MYWGDDETGMRVLAGTGLSLLLIGYITMVIRGWRDAAAYKGGFVRSDCPVCGGELVMEERPYSFLGIRRVRRTVRCRRCRSILRQVGRRQWRYAVDVVHNRELFRRYNGHVVSERELVDLPPAPPPPAQPPWETSEPLPVEEAQIGPEPESEMGGPEESPVDTSEPVPVEPETTPADEVESPAREPAPSDETPPEREAESDEEPRLIEDEDLDEL